MKISTLILFIFSIVILLPILGLIKLLYNTELLQRLVDSGFITNPHAAMKYILFTIFALSVLECILVLILSIKTLLGAFKTNEKDNKD